MTAKDKVIVYPYVHAHPGWQGAHLTIAGLSLGIFLFILRLKKEMPPVVYMMLGQ